ncbi:sulfite exporter TauE/SafE family protein [Acetivibrio thermocellus]|uniref:sulfite exporter TauE/SafE family protein n=1 Tax=Acetivibrio thermocellus TaxID=1515 RepID=UPI0021AD7872|nr:sulfite exporter TauE/SafE family protein [Acetivibrio thermocellus]UWV47943.1 sulfite exporter TauE/SafE family protein [Acetivibrio thermocellus]
MVLFLIGLASGIVSGMGIGGGAILIPALVFFVNPDQHIAQSVNLLFFIPTAVIALIVHIKNKRVNFKLTIPIVIFGLVGAFLGSKLAVSLSGASLKRYFGMFLLILGFYEMVRKDKKETKKQGGRA